MTCQEKLLKKIEPSFRRALEWKLQTAYLELDRLRNRTGKVLESRVVSASKVGQESAERRASDIRDWYEKNMTDIALLLERVFYYAQQLTDTVEIDEVDKDDKKSVGFIDGYLTSFEQTSDAHDEQKVHVYNLFGVVLEEPKVIDNWGEYQVTNSVGMEANKNE